MPVSIKSSLRGITLALATLVIVGYGATAQGKARSTYKPDAAHRQHAVLVWHDEFDGGSKPKAPNPENWVIRGASWANAGELETYCKYRSDVKPCDEHKPNVYVADNHLHIVVRNPSPGVYTSARLATEGLHSFKYGRIEARIKMSAGIGLWPAFWMLGDSIKTVGWPECGEIDIMESVGRLPYTNVGSIHGKGFVGEIISTGYTRLHGQPFTAGFHVFGIIWSPNKIQFYIDKPTRIYATYTPESLPEEAKWPFNNGKFFLLLNLAVGGKWAGALSDETHFPKQMLVDYVRVYKLHAGRTKPDLNNAY